MAESAKSSSSTTGSGSSDVRSEIDALKADLAALRTDLKGITGALYEEGKTQASAARHRVENEARARADALDEYVTEHPLTTLALAVGAGMLLSKILGGK
jgi:ElaB/YqjD/DUF883 family membrane-anchored ribosome-binding protein